MQFDVAKIIDAWRSGDEPSVTETLRSYPEILPTDSVVFDLIHEEMQLRQERGLVFDSSKLRDQFPEHFRAVEEFIACQMALADMGDFFCDSLLESASEKSSWPAAGGSWNGLHIIQTLAVTSTSAIFLARDQRMGGRIVILKLSQNDSNEPRLQGPLVHPGIMPILSVHHPDDSGPRGTVMPYWGKATLADLIHSLWTTRSSPKNQECLSDFATLACGSFPPEMPHDSTRPIPASFPELVLDVGTQIGEALAYLHDRDVVHCDVKPANVLTSPFGHVVLLDFNLSQRQSGNEGCVGGTIPYMSPRRIELLLADPAEIESVGVDPRDDLFSLGVTLCELLTGKLPFTPPDPRSPLHEQLLQMRRHQNSPLPIRVPADAPSQLVLDLCQRLYGQNESQFESIEEFLLEADRVRRQLRQAATAKDNNRLSLRRMWLTLAACACLLVLRMSLDHIEKLPLTDIETRSTTVHRPHAALTQLLVWIDPGNEARWVALGNHFLAHGMLELGSQSYSHAESLDGDCYAALNNRGLVAWKRGEFAEADELFTNAIQAAPNQVEAHFNRGCLRHERLVHALENQLFRRGSIEHARLLRRLSEDLRSAELLADKASPQIKRIALMRAWVAQQIDQFDPV